MSGQIEFTFKAEPDDPRLVILKARLRDSGWVTARQLKCQLGLSDRDCRALAEASEGEIISGQKGYKLTEQSTPEETKYSSAWLISQGQKMIRRGIAIRRCAHAHLG